jgi:hypothetical protein
MPSNSIIVHLANVLMIAEADGAFTEPEAAALREIMHRIGAGPGDLAAARDWMARNAPYRLQVIPDSADTMKMIEDMVLMSLADGQVSRNESRPLEAFLSNLGFVQADMDLIVQRVRPRLRNIPAAPHPAMPARRDDAAVPSGKASRPLTPPAKAVRPPPPPVRAPAAPQGSAPHQTPVPQPAASEPVAAAASSPQREAPAPVSPPEGAAESPLDRCGRLRANAPLGDGYCFGAPDEPLNPWGCRLTGMAWTADADWHRLGRFRDSDTFVFDREAIAARLHQRLGAVSGCPFLLGGFAQQALSALPSLATTMGRWRHHLVSQATPSATAVTVRSYSHGCRREVAAWSDGLAPTDDQDARRMIRRTARRTGAAIDLNLLDHTKEADHA